MSKLRSAPISVEKTTNKIINLCKQLQELPLDDNDKQDLVHCEIYLSKIKVKYERRNISWRKIYKE